MHFSLPAIGGRNCGGLRYPVTQQPLTSYICHCHLCQKRTGRAFSMSVVFPESAFFLESGEPVRTERVTANGSKNCAYVCGQCFSRIYTQRERSRTINLRAGTLDDTANIRPVAQIWTSSAQACAIMKRGDVLSFPEQPKDFDEIFAAWKAAR